jgi:hypothetical protein
VSCAWDVPIPGWARIVVEIEGLREDLAAVDHLPAPAVVLARELCQPERPASARASY